MHNSLELFRNERNIAVFNAGDVIFLVQQTPFFALEVMHTMAERLRRYLQPQE